MHACLPGPNLTSFNYRLSVAKHILHVIIAVTVFMAMTVHQSVMLQALMVSKGALDHYKAFFSFKLPAL